MTINLLIVDDLLRSNFDREDLDGALTGVEYCNSLEEGEKYLSPDMTVHVAVVHPIVDADSRYRNAISFMRALREKGTKVILYTGGMEEDYKLIPEDCYDAHLGLCEEEDLVDNVNTVLND